MYPCHMLDEKEIYIILINLCFNMNVLPYLCQHTFVTIKNL